MTKAIKLSAGEENYSVLLDKIQRECWFQTVVLHLAASSLWQSRRFGGNRARKHARSCYYVQRCGLKQAGEGSHGQN